jgi:hypothetical protein
VNLRRKCNGAQACVTEAADLRKQVVGEYSNGVKHDRKDVLELLEELMQA